MVRTVQTSANPRHRFPLPNPSRTHSKLPNSHPPAPFPSPAGPGILPFFEGLGPYYRWLPPSEVITLETMKAGSSTPDLDKEVERLVRSTVSRIHTNGGRVVGLIGFSQGTKVVAGLLRARQIRNEVGARGEEWLDAFQCAVSVCGSYRPPLLPGCVGKLPEVQRLGEQERQQVLGRKIQAPVFHVQGERDEWKWAGDGLIEECYEVKQGASEVRVWDMGHFYPTRGEESEEIAEWLVEQLGGLEGVKGVE